MPEKFVPQSDNCETARALYNTGRELMASGRWQDAIEAFAASNALSPGHWVTLLYWGKALQALGQHQEAVEVLSEAVSLNPKGMGSLQRRSASYAALGMIGSAIRDLEAALQIEPGARRLVLELEALREQLEEASDGTTHPSPPTTHYA